eukprot:GILI01004004.1.p1 GENE.GILI01004004.1~~GILI01004004.1.p1  ORF type:complete len:363 (-),score=48.95 GILI01004004.1:641-1729(-)
MSDSEEYLWLIYTEAISFGLISLFCIVQLVQHYRASKLAPDLSANSAGWSFRKYFHILLCLANAARASALLLEVALDNEYGDTPEAWLNYLVRTFPSLLFLSTYSVLILFWAQLYYSATLVSYPLLKPTFVFLNISIYFIYFVVAVLTFMLNAFYEFHIYTLFVIGTVHLIAACGFLYYGLKVSVQLSARKARYSFTARNVVIKRVLFLSIFCTVIFLVRGIYDVLVATHVVTDFYPPGFNHYLWDALSFFFVELMTSFIYLLLTRKRTADLAGPEAGVGSNKTGESGRPLIQSSSMNVTLENLSHSLAGPAASGNVRVGFSGRGGGNYSSFGRGNAGAGEHVQLPWSPPPPGRPVVNVPRS